MILKFLKSRYATIKSALQKTSSVLIQKLKTLSGKDVNEEILDQLEQLFFEADLGVDTSMELVEKIRVYSQKNPKISFEDILKLIHKEIMTILSHLPTSMNEASEGATVILVVGVNGGGKTTSVAKLAHMYKNNHKRVLLSAADTFRAGAIDQLDKWASKIGVDIVKNKPHSDPSAVVFDSLAAGKARNSDVVIIDTAGRLHTKTHLMQELGKIKKVCKKFSTEAPHETLLIIDATSGQNAIEQAISFNEYTPITGIILTKLDGTAKGGIVVAMQRKLNIPIKFIGIGEGLNDLHYFDAEEFTTALLYE